MVQGIARDSGLTVGVDLGDRFGELCVLDASGEVVQRDRLAMDERSVRERLAGYPISRVVMEVGTHSAWVSRVASELGHEVLVANARKLRFIYASENKSDSVDAEALARVGRLDPQLLKPIRHRSVTSQADRTLLRSRDALVRTRTALVNHVRGATKSMGQRLPTCSSESFAKRVRGALPETLRAALEPIVAVIEDLTRRIRAYDRTIEARCRSDYPETQLLEQVTGVGSLTALAFVLCLEDPARFRRSRSVGSYLGLRPRRNQSGEQDRQLRITKAGDEYVRRLLVGSAHYILGPFGPDSALRRFGLRLAERGGKAAKKRAITAVARKLAVLLHRLWTTGEVYEPLRGTAPA